MQSATDGPRGAYSAEQVAYVIENSSSADTDMGLELIDQGLHVLGDASEWLRVASVSRNSYANIHAALTFTIDQPLDWGSAIVRPYMTMTAPTGPGEGLATMKFYLGAYITDTPGEDMSLDVSSFDATGYDLLSILDDPVGDGYSIDAGELYLARVEQILLNVGITQYVIDQDAGAVTLPSPKSYTLDDNVTWLTIINDLLGAVGYAGIYSDHNGVFRAHVYRTPRDRGPEWFMSDDPALTILTQRRKRNRDFYDAPNHWVIYQQNNTEEEQASNANGLRYEYTNNSDGMTSVAARGGRVKTKVMGVDAADAASLAAAAQRTIDADMLIPQLISIETAPFPLAWHFDRIHVQDAGLGASLQVMATNWALNLDGSDMTWEWVVL